MDVLQQIIDELAKELANVGLSEVGRAESKDRSEILLQSRTPVGSRLGDDIPISLLLEHRPGEKMVQVSLYVLVPLLKRVKVQGNIYNKNPLAARHLLKDEILAWIGWYRLVHTVA